MTARRRSTIASVVASALCVPAAVGVVLLAGKASATAADEGARHGALGAAAKIARDILSYDYRTIDRDLARARAETTGEFAGHYASAAAELRSEATRTQAIVQARVRDIGVVAAASDRVTVLVFADQVSITRPAAAATPTTRVVSSAVQITLTKSGDRWRASAVSAVQTGAPSSAAG